MNYQIGQINKSKSSIFLNGGWVKVGDTIYTKSNGNPYRHQTLGTIRNLLIHEHKITKVEIKKNLTDTYNLSSKRTKIDVDYDITIYVDSDAKLFSDSTKYLFFHSNLAKLFTSKELAETYKIANEKNVKPGSFVWLYRQNNTIVRKEISHFFDMHINIHGNLWDYKTYAACAYSDKMAFTIKERLQDLYATYEECLTAHPYATLSRCSAPFRAGFHQGNDPIVAMEMITLNN